MFLARHYIAPLLLVGLLGCDNHSNSHSESHDPNIIDHQVHKELNLSLNGTAKWKMDDHTRRMFARMDTKFEGIDAASVGNDQIRSLGRSLDDDIKTLIAGCTMVGEAHNELHKYLVAFMPAVGELMKSGTLKDAQTVQSLLKVYPQYFE